MWPSSSATTSRARGYDVVVAGSGDDAIKQAREVQPDLVLLDIMVPQVNGWEVCRRLKQDAGTRAIPVIMVTGRVEEGDKVLGFEMGADDYVTSPSRRASWSRGSARSSGVAAGRSARRS